MRRAVAEASNEHDGAYRYSMDMKTIAEKYKVPLNDLIRETNYYVEELRQWQAIRDTAEEPADEQ